MLSVDWATGQLTVWLIKVHYPGQCLQCHHLLLVSYFSEMLQRNMPTSVAQLDAHPMGDQEGRGFDTHSTWVSNILSCA